MNPTPPPSDIEDAIRHGAEMAAQEGPGKTTLIMDGKVQDVELKAAPKKPTKEQLRQAVQVQLRKTGLNRHGRRALLAQVRRKARR